MTALFLRRILHPSALLALGLALAAALPAQAQNATAGAPPSVSIPLQPAPPPGGDWKNEKFERQEFREEMEKIRKEHEELEQARDKLLDQCVNAAGAQAAECEKQKQALHEWHDRLHERMRVLHEKMQAEHQAHPPGINAMNGTQQAWPHPSMNGAPPAPLQPAGQ